MTFNKRTIFNLLGILAALAGVVLAFAGADVKRPDANPISGVALALCALAFFQAAKTD